MNRLSEKLGKVMAVVLGSAMLVSMTAISQTNAVLPSQEITVWGEDSIRGYGIHDTTRRFLYPELIVSETNRVLVGFLIGPKYIVRSVQNDLVTNFFELDSQHEWFFTNGLPQIFVQSNGFVVTQVREMEEKHHAYALATIALDQNGRKTGKEEQFPLVVKKKPNDYRLKSVLLLDDTRYLVTGEWYELHMPISPDPMTCNKNCALLYSNRTNTSIQRIEDRGRFSVFDTVYLATPDQPQCAWIRRSDILFSKNNQQSICYSRCSIGGQWEAPRVLFSLKSPNFSLLDISAASIGGRTLVVWVRDGDGIYGAEIGEKKSAGATTKIGDWSGYDLFSWGTMRGDYSIYRVSLADACADAAGNFYVVWTLKRGAKHKIALRACLNGQWTQEYTVSEGLGLIWSPRIKVDANGEIHLVYLKETGGRLKCFYRKLPKAAEWNNYP